MMNFWSCVIHFIELISGQGDYLSKAQIETRLAQELAAWQEAVADGMVIVWAAGNDRDNNVSIRAGLPAYFENLKPGWLAVVAVGPDGSEPTYTNRSGISSEWCITAPYRWSQLVRFMFR